MRFPNKIRDWRVHRHMSQDALANATGLYKSYISELERGLKPWNQRLLERLGHALDATPEEIVAGTPSSENGGREEGVPILGAVAANGETYHLWNYDPAVIVDRLPVAVRGAEMALPIKGESMYPRFREGEYAVVGSPALEPDRLIGADVVAQVEDGRIVIKVLERCPTGRWTLTSVNPMFKRIEDVELDWVRPVLMNVIHSI